MSVVLVTGGAGFIGSHIVDDLVAAGHGVRVLDSLTPAAHDRKPEYLNRAAEYVWEDIRDVRAVDEALAGVTAVCHQAAVVGLGVDFGDVCDYVDVNDAGTAVLLGGLHRRRFAGPIVLASSMAVYGEGRYACPEHGPVRPGPRSRAHLEAGQFEPPCPACGASLRPEPVPEDTPADPRNVYAATKLHQEHLCAAYGREHGASVTILRYHNVYGPRMPRETPYAGVASLFRSALEASRAPEVFEDGGQRRDFIHVADVARANLLALAGGHLGPHHPTPDRPPAIFNVASGQSRTVLEMAEAIAAAFAPSALEPKVTGAFRLGDVRHVFASPERARAGLGFEARVTFEEGMAEFAHAPMRAQAPRESDQKLAGSRSSRWE